MAVEVEQGTPGVFSRQGESKLQAVQQASLVVEDSVNQMSPSPNILSYSKAESMVHDLTRSESLILAV
ncbi:hypothetical protein PCANC_23827 [Puccinia coronata f. sp. avenae]|uniref:Uncharacterized protein n=1 Tax=Puccinia coronata f. sp. avenae TaxID=200324 RepID=A0A2N5S6M4_9BASI|nr:hypothetical protein PCANC_23827 [Puccinia coronata f. sp. avenae]